MKKLLLSLAVVAFITVGAIAAGNSQTQDPPKKVEVKKETTVATTKTAETKECAPAEKKACCETAKECDTKKVAKKKIK